MLLCCGEALIDMIPVTLEGGQTAFVPHSGGAIFNTAIASGRLGVPTALFTGVSTDRFGQQLSDALADSGVLTDRLVRSARPTTMAFVHLTDGHASYTFYDENSAGRMLHPEDIPDLGGDVSALYFGGISLVTEPCAETYAEMAVRYGKDRAIMVDPNIRPGFITDPDRLRARLGRMFGVADIVKVSDEDLDWLYPNLPVGDQIARLHQAGAGLVIMTRGGSGSTGYLADGTQVSAPAEMVEVVDTVGAGDTFNAGVLTQLHVSGALQKQAIRALGPEALGAALRFGARVAAVTVSRAGANPPWLRELR